MFRQLLQEADLEVQREMRDRSLSETGRYQCGRLGRGHNARNQPEKSSQGSFRPDVTRERSRDQPESFKPVVHLMDGVKHDDHLKVPAPPQPPTITEEKVVKEKVGT